MGMNWVGGGAGFWATGFWATGFCGAGLASVSFWASRSVSRGPACRSMVTIAIGNAASAAARTSVPERISLSPVACP